MEKLDRLEDTFSRNYFTYVENVESGVDDNKMPHDFEIKSVVDDKPLCSLHFQQGNPFDVGINGIRNEDLIRILIERIKTYEKFDSESIEDENALSRLHEAYYWIAQKRSKRKKELANKLARL